MLLRNILTLVAVMALALFMVPTNSFAADGAKADGPRECASKLGHEYAKCHRLNGVVPFRTFAEYHARKNSMDVEELITLNNWGSFVDIIETDPTTVYLILLPQEPFTVASR